MNFVSLEGAIFSLYIGKLFLEAIAWFAGLLNHLPTRLEHFGDEIVKNSFGKNL